MDLLSLELLKETLSELLSPDLETREDAKRKIEVLKGKESFAVDLTKFFIGPPCELTIKELSITILKEWIEIHWSPSIPNFVPPVATSPTKHRILFTCMAIMLESETKTYNVIKVQAIEIFTMLVGFVPKWYEDEDNVIPSFLQSPAQTFCEKFTKILKEKNCPSSNIRLKSAVFKAIAKVCDEIPKFFYDSSTEMLPPIWETFIDAAKTYHEFKTDANGDFKDKNENTDDKIVNDYDDLITAVLEFIKQLLDRPAMFDFGAYTLSEYHWFHLHASISPVVLHTLITLMEPTERQIQLWADNPSQFIKEEEAKRNWLRDKVPCSSIRGKAHRVLNYIIDTSGSYPARTTEHDLTNVIIKQLIDEIRSGRTKRQRMDNWKQHEAYLLAFCIVKPIIDERWNEERLFFDIDYFFEKIILPDLKYSQTPPLLLCQCLRLGRLFIAYMGLRMKKRFVEATINCLRENKSMCTRISAANSAHCWFQEPHWTEDPSDKNKLHSRIPALFDRLLDLGNQSMSAEVLWLVLENFAILTPLKKKGTASVVEKLCKFTVAAFLKLHSDHTVLDYCRNYFQKLAINPEYTGLLQKHLIPALVDMMTAADPSNELAGKTHIRAIFVLKLLMKNQLEPLEHNSVLIKSALPALYYCILIHNDHMTLISGAEVICNYLSAAPLQTIECKDIDGKTGSQYILQIASHFLKPESKGCLVKSACTIVTLLIKRGPKLTESIDELVKALITRLWAESEDDTKKQLLVVCARLITQFDTVYKYLSNVSGPNEQSALSFIVYDGFCKNYKSFSPDEHKLINLALATVLDHGITYNDHRLSEVTVQEGEKGKETTIPLLVGITKFIRAMLSDEAGSI